MEQINEDTIALHWTTKDVMHECDWLTKEQAREVLSMCLHKHDANHGVSWEIIDIWACQMFPKHSTKQV
tara:strand:+ start:134 stop:340 length:207 start_codon:yes stop_codon:yes gene_type:complete